VLAGLVTARSIWGNVWLPILSAEEMGGKFAHFLWLGAASGAAEGRMAHRWRGEGERGAAVVGAAGPEILAMMLI